jgi:hypothetical protein
MGLDVLLNVVAVPAGTEPDWESAIRRIDALGLDELDAFFDYWDPDGDSRSEASEDPEYVPRLKSELQHELSDIRRALLETSAGSETFVLGGYRFLATGGPSVGSVPTELYDSISRLHAVGALAAGGFVPVLVDEP